MSGGPVNPFDWNNPFDIALAVFLALFFGGILYNIFRAGYLYLRWRMRYCDTYALKEPFSAKIRQWLDDEGSHFRVTFGKELGRRPLEILTVGRSSDVKEGWIDDRRFFLDLPKDSCFLMLARMRGKLYLMRADHFVCFQDTFDLNLKELYFPIPYTGGLIMRREVREEGSPLITVSTPSGSVVWRGLEQEGLDGLATLLVLPNSGLTSSLITERDGWAGVAAAHGAQLEFMRAHFVTTGKMSALLGQLQAYLAGDKDAAGQSRRLIESGAMVRAQRRAPAAKAEPATATAEPAK